MASLVDIFNPSFFMFLGILVLVAALLVVYFESKMREQNHKMASMLNLITCMADEMNAIKLHLNSHHSNNIGGTMLQPSSLEKNDIHIIKTDLITVSDDSESDNDSENSIEDDESDNGSESSSSNNSENNDDIKNIIEIGNIDIRDNNEIKVLKLHLSNINNINNIDDDIDDGNDIVNLCHSLNFVHRVLRDKPAKPAKPANTIDLNENEVSISFYFCCLKDTANGNKNSNIEEGHQSVHSGKSGQNAVPSI